MKRLFLLFSISVATLFSSCNILDSETPKRQGWDEDTPLYGNVESVTVTAYYLEERFGEAVRGGVECCDKYYFNTSGDVVEQANYYLGWSHDGKLMFKTIYKYDSNGNQIEVAKYHSDGSLWDKYAYKYDSRGNMIEEAYYNSDGLLRYKEIVKYDSHGNKIEEVGYNPRYKHTYKYDSRGNMVEKAHYNSDGALRGKYTYKYDSHGSMIERTDGEGPEGLPMILVYDITYRD